MTEQLKTTLFGIAILLVAVFSPQEQRDTIFLSGIFAAAILIINELKDILEELKKKVR